MDEDEPTTMLMVATCHTPGCPAGSVTALLTGIGTPPVFFVGCAQCGQPVTDVVPAAA